MEVRKRIDQTEFGERGNCQSACIAMMLGLPIASVPNFFDGLDMADENLSEKWCDAQRQWLQDLGWASICVNTRGYYFKKHFSRGFIIASGPASRGHMHSVVYKDGELWHDPHPSREGLIEVYEAEVLYPLDATAHIFNFHAHLVRQAAWSKETFGPNYHHKRIVNHIGKELREIEANPGDLEEWIDVVLLALDGAWRSGASPEEIINAMVAKQAKNEARSWPDWRTMDPNKAIEHDRTGEAKACPLRCPRCDSAMLNLGCAMCEHEWSTGPSEVHKVGYRHHLAVAAGFKPPPDGDGFWHHDDIGAVHEEGMDQYLREHLLKALEKLVYSPESSMKHPFTETYIIMAKAAGEIQSLKASLDYGRRLPSEEWHPGLGFFFHVEDFPADFFLKEPELLARYNDPGHRMIAGYGMDGERIFWIPRLDQLFRPWAESQRPEGLAGLSAIKMSHEPGFIDLYDPKAIESWKKYIGQFQDWHEVGLALWMREKHKKTWDGKGWVKAS